MRGPRVAETLERINPIVVTTDEGFDACPWPYFKRTEKGVIAAVVWEMDLHEECTKFGFQDYSIHKDREHLQHELRLLGPDSPGEYIYNFDSRLIGDDGIEDLARDMVWWVKQMYVIYQIQTGE